MAKEPSSAVHQMSNSKFCNDYGDAPLCQRDPDPRYTMDFSDVEPGAVLLWCAHCGPIAHAMQTAIMKTAETRGQEFIENFSSAVDAATNERKVQ